MRALTVRQPWAAAIIHWGKGVENRTRNIAGGYRGPVAIHAGLRADEGQWPRELLRAVMAADLTGGRDDVRGAFIGVVDLVDAHRCSALNVTREVLCCDSPWAELPYDERHGGRRVPDLWHLELANPRPLVEPVRARGRLGLWTPTAEQTLAIVERIGHAA